MRKTVALLAAALLVTGVSASAAGRTAAPDVIMNVLPPGQSGSLALGPARHRPAAPLRPPDADVRRRPLCRPRPHVQAGALRPRRAEADPRRAAPPGRPHPPRQ